MKSKKPKLSVPPVHKQNTRDRPEYYPPGVLHNSLPIPIIPFTITKKPKKKSQKVKTVKKLQKHSPSQNIDIAQSLNSIKTVDLKQAHFELITDGKIQESDPSSLKDVLGTQALKLSLLCQSVYFLMELIVFLLDARISY